MLPAMMNFPSRNYAPTLLVLLLLASPAFAYVDPGTGSFLVQLLIAGVLGIGYYIKTSWWRLKTWVMSFGRKKPPAPPEAPAKKDE